MAFPKWMRVEAGRRRGWACEKCGRRFADGWIIEAHHIVPTSQGGQDTFENLQLLCVECHYKEHVRLAACGRGHPRSAQIILRRLEKSGGRTRRWLKLNPRRNRRRRGNVFLCAR